MDKKIFHFFILLLFTGCSVIPLGIEPASEQLRDGQGNNKKYNIIGSVDESSGYFSLFSIIPFGSININDTFNEIAKERGGDALINIRYWYRTSFYFVGTYYSLEVKGDAIKFIQ
ncbi:MAG: hypothetical protein Q8M94_09285 [Ignavibacteria bacterium]|nr:hypothetical protein [Ignavibacteria bacterium]